MWGRMLFLAENTLSDMENDMIDRGNAKFFSDVAVNGSGKSV